MMTCVNGKDHALSSGPRVALPGLLRDHLLFTGTKKSRNRQSMTNAETETGTQTFPFLGHHSVRRTHGSAVEEWQPHRPQGDRSAEWWNLTAVACDPASTRYFLSWTVTHPGRRHLGQQPPQVITQIKPGQGLYACLRRSGAPGTVGGRRRCRGPAPDPARWLPMGHPVAGLLHQHARVKARSKGNFLCSQPSSPGEAKRGKGNTTALSASVEILGPGTMPWADTRTSVVPIDRSGAAPGGRGSEAAVPGSVGGGMESCGRQLAKRNGGAH